MSFRSKAFYDWSHTSCRLQAAQFISVTNEFPTGDTIMKILPISLIVVLSASLLACQTK